jgi:hypothetical protein
MPKEFDCIDCIEHDAATKVEESSLRMPLSEDVHGESLLGTDQKECINKGEEHEQGQIAFDEEERILDTDTILGKSVAFMLGKKVPTHKNIFDLMDSAASKLMKNALGRKKPTICEVPELQLSAKSPLDTNLNPIDTDSPNPNSCKNTAESIAQSDASETTESPAVDKGAPCSLPPIVRVKVDVMRREETILKGSQAFCGQSFKAATVMQLQQLRMGEVRFNFDDMFAMNKNELISTLKTMGEKTDLKELQKFSVLQLRECMRERQSDLVDQIKIKNDGRQPVVRMNQVLSRRSPEMKAASPETLQKWHTAVQKAGVPCEDIRFMNQTNLAHRQTDARDKEALLEGTSIDGEESDKSFGCKFPRMVNAEHIELLLNHSQPKQDILRPLPLIVNIAPRISRSEFLWKILCPFDCKK